MKFDIYGRKALGFIVNHVIYDLRYTLTGFQQFNILKNPLIHFSYLDCPTEI